LKIKNQTTISTLMADVILAYLDDLEAAGDDDEEAARSATLLFETSVNAHVKAGLDRMTAKQLPGWYCEKFGKNWSYISPDKQANFTTEAKVREYIEFCNTGSPSAAARAAFAHDFGPGWELFRMGKSWKCVSPEGQEFPSLSAAKKYLKALSKETETTPAVAVPTEATEPSPFSFAEAPSAVSTQEQGSILTIPFGRNTTLCIVPSGIGKNPITSVANDGGVVSTIDLLNFSGSLRFVTTSDNPMVTAKKQTKRVIESSDDESIEEPLVAAVTTEKKRKRKRVIESSDEESVDS
jgi:hypothetical protein